MVESGPAERWKILIFGVAAMVCLSGCGESKDLPIDVGQPSAIQDCTPGYKPCLPELSDYDCKGGQGDGPGYTGRVEVTGTDPYDLDRDRDGFGC